MNPILSILNFMLKDEAVLLKFQNDFPPLLVAELIQFKDDSEYNGRHRVAGFFTAKLRENPSFLKNYATDHEAFDTEWNRIQTELSSRLEEQRKNRRNKGQTL